MSSTLTIKSKKKKKGFPNSLEGTFNILKARVEELQKECIKRTKTLDSHLEFYEKFLFPQEQEIGACLRREIKMFSPYLKEKKQLKKEERSILKQILEGLFEKISVMEGPNMALDEELSNAFQETLGYSYQEQQSESFEDFKKKTEQEFSQKGVRLDLSDVKMEGSLEDSMSRIMESMREQGAFSEKEEEPQAKSKREIEKEEKAQELETLQKKEIGSIYKQLAKVVHPDLEIDPSRKLEKEEIMKRLTSAYEARDLHALLALELEIASGETGSKKALTENQLKVYNNLLLTQIEELQGKLQEIPMNFKYSPLHTYREYRWNRGEAVLIQVQKVMNAEIKDHRLLIDQGEKEGALTLLRKAIAKSRFRNSERNSW